MTVIAVEGLEVHYKQRGRPRARFHAVDGVSFTVGEGETLGVVGESGSGKSTIGRAILGLAPVSRGHVEMPYAGRGRRARAAALQAIFQDPYSSLDAQRTIGQTLSEPLEVQRVPRAERDRRILELLERVGLPANAVERYPHEFSGGQRQRIAIARALVMDPQLVVCDEPISALDLSTQAAVLNLLQELQDEFGVAYIFVAHDLVAVRHLSDQVVVLYRGRAMEQGPAELVCETPLHPYSRALWAASPVPDPVAQRERRAGLERATAVSAAAAAPPPPDGCPFAPRCPTAADVCWSTRPSRVEAAGRALECHLFDSDSAHPDAGRGVELMGSAPGAAPAQPSAIAPRSTDGGSR